jgi:hypothetical protein
VIGQKGEIKIIQTDPELDPKIRIWTLYVKNELFFKA